ncbi:MAG: 50S ribosomal protein L16 [Deltaproteobacteria bacterium]|nr:50S ribosomal protein L16 [Deltaproteobacteria bacterium]
MLSPRKIKHRKQMKRLRNIRGVDNRGCDLDFGDYGLRAVEGGWITNRQIEAGRVAIARQVKRAGKMWIRVFPDHPLTSKPAEVRMGKGKGSPEKWVANVKTGRIMFELTGVPENLARQALQRAAAKMPVRTEIVIRSKGLL